MAEENNVPFIGPRHRCEIISVNPVLLVQKMASGNLNGAKPSTASLTYDKLDPVITAGKALWDNLTAGGLFNFTKKAIIIEALSSGTWLIVEETTPNTYVVTRPTPTTFPFRLSPDEKLQISGVAAATVLARLDIQRCI